MMRKQKKGSERLNNMMASLVIVVSFLIIFTTTALSVDTEAKFLLDFYSHDVSMIIEATQAVPGDIILHYPIEDHFRISLFENKILTTYLPKGAIRERSFHLLPQNEVHEESGTHYLKISKEDDIISIHGQKQTTQTSCPPTVAFSSNDFSVAINTGTTSSSVFSSNELMLLKNTISYKLEKEGLLTKSTPTIHIILSADEPSRTNDITFERPIGTSIQDMNYDYLLCNFFQRYQTNKFSLRQNTTKDIEEDYEITIIFSLNEENKKLLLETRDEFATAIVASLTTLKVMSE